MPSSDGIVWVRGNALSARPATGRAGIIPSASVKMMTTPPLQNGLPHHRSGNEVIAWSPRESFDPAGEAEPDESGGSVLSVTSIKINTGSSLDVEHARIQCRKSAGYRFFTNCRNRLPVGVWKRVLGEDDHGEMVSLEQYFVDLLSRCT
jgi:hypothetical protein